MKRTRTPREKMPTIAECRDQIEKTGMVHMSMIQDDENTIRVLPENITKALRGLNKAEDQVIFPMLGIAVPAYYLLKFAPLMGEYAATLKVDRNTMVITMTYSAAPDSKSRTQIKGIDALDFEPDANGLKRPEFTARVTTDRIETAAKIDLWIRKAVSKDDARPEMMKPFGKFSADGYRLHYDRRLELTVPSDEYVSPSKYEYTRTMAESVLHTASRADNAALVNVTDFLAAMKRAAKANKGVVELSVNGRLDVTAQSDDLSQIVTTITENYQHAGDNVQFGIDPRFVIDALSGMTGDVVIGISEPSDNGGRMFYVSDGAREAVIISKNCQ